MRTAESERRSAHVTVYSAVYYVERGGHKAAVYVAQTLNGVTIRILTSKVTRGN